MELRQLEHFVAVAEDESFTRAARRLGYVQSALSVSIQALERELAVRLFDRTTHRVALTDAGETLLGSARATLAAAETFRDDAAAVHGVVRGRLRIGAMQAFTVVNVPRLVGRFHREHPQVQLTMRPDGGGVAGMLSAVADGELDLAFAATAELPKGLRRLPLKRESLLLVSAESEEPRLGASVQLADLADQSFVDFPPGWILRTLVDRAFAQRDLQRTVAIEVADVPSCRQLVREGLGVAVLPESIVAIDPLGLRRHELIPGLTWDPAVVVRADAPLSPATAAFLKLLEFES